MKLRKIVENHAKDGRLISYKVDVHLEGIKPKWEFYRLDQRQQADARLHTINAALFANKGRKIGEETEQRVPMTAVRDRIFEALANPNSRAAYETVIGHLSARGVQFIDEITADHVRTILNEGHFRKKSAVKIILFTDLLIRRAKTFFNARTHIKYRKINLKDGGELIKMEKPKKKGYLSEEQIKEILVAFEGRVYSYNQFFFATLAKWGFRVSELINLRWRDIEKVQGRWMVMVHGKGGHDQVNVTKDRHFEIGLAFKDELWSHSCTLYKQRFGREPGADDFVFINPRNIKGHGVQLTYSGLVKQWITILQDCKIDYKAHTIHSLRRFACWWLWKHTKDMMYVKSVCGWDGNSIKYYENPDQNAGKSALDAIGSGF